MTDLIAAAHGTADPRGIRVIHALTREIARQRPGLPVSLGFVDVDRPALPSLVDRVVADSNQTVIVPLLLSSGYHVSTDVQAEAHRRPHQVSAAGPLGPHPVLAQILADRLIEGLAGGGDRTTAASPTHWATGDAASPIGFVGSTASCWRRRDPPTIGLCLPAPGLLRSWRRWSIDRLRSAVSRAPGSGWAPYWLGRPGGLLLPLTCSRLASLLTGSPVLPHRRVPSPPSRSAPTRAWPLWLFTGTTRRSGLQR